MQKRSVFKTSTRDNGFILLPVMILLALSISITAPLAGLLMTNLKADKKSENRMFELYAADAGLNDALWRVKAQHPDLPHVAGTHQDYYIYNLNNQTVSVRITLVDYTSVYHIVSHAYAGGAGTTLEADARSNSTFRNALVATGGDIELSGGSVYAASGSDTALVYANGNISMTGGASMSGDVSATGTITPIQSVHGTATPNMAPRTLSTIDTSPYLQQANAGTLISGNLTIGSARTLGPAHITGNLTINGALVTLTGTVWVDGIFKAQGGGFVTGSQTIVSVGSVTLSGGAHVPPGDIPLIISTTGGITLSGGATTSGVLYAPNGPVVISGGTTLNGAATGRSVTISGGGNVEFPNELLYDRVLPSGLDLLTLDSKLR